MTVDSQHYIIQGTRYTYAQYTKGSPGAYTQWTRKSILPGFGSIYYLSGQSGGTSGTRTESFRMTHYNGMDMDSLLKNSPTGLNPLARSRVHPAARRFDLHHMGIFLGRQPRPSAR